MRDLRPILVFLAVVTPTVVRANNGHTAIALPVSGITVDGDFGDWPKSLTRHPLRCNHFGDSGQDAADISAWFQVGYDQKTEQLFVAVEVRDDSFVVHADHQESEHAWKSRDSAGVYLSVEHGPHGHPVNEAVSIGYDSELSGSHIQARSQRQDGVGRFEWCLNIRELRGNRSAANQRFTIALCVEALDYDADGTFSILYWSPHSWKGQTADRAGDLVVGVRKNELGKVAGRLSNIRGENPMGPTRVRFSAQANPDLVVDILTSADGKYEATLPAGQYDRIVLDWSRHPKPVSVLAGRTTRSDIVLAPSAVTRDLGAGRTYTTHAPVSGRISNELDETSYEIRTYSVVNGIPAGPCRDVVVTERGAVWIANELGLAKIIGNRTTSYGETDGLPSNAVNCLHLAEGQEVWVGTAKGLARISQSGSQVTVFQQLRGKSILQIGKLHDGRLGIATDRGFYVYDGEEVQSYGRDAGFEEVRCLSICPDPSGEFTWIGTDSGLRHFDGRRVVQTLTRETGLPDNRIWATSAQQSGALWFGANRSIFTLKDGEFATVRSHPSETYRHCSSIFEDAHGQVWCNSRMDDGSIGIVVYKRDAPDKVVKEFRHDVEAIRIDGFDNIWLLGHGYASQLQTKRMRVAEGKCLAVRMGQFEKADLSEFRNLSDVIPKVRLKSEQMVWYAIERDGICYLRRISASVPERIETQVACPDSITTLENHETDPNKLWVGTKSKGLFLFDGQSFRYPEATREPNGTGPEEWQWPRKESIFCLKRHSSGSLWCATDQGIFVVRGGQVEKVYSIASGLPTSRINHLDECPDQRIVCGTYSGVLFLDHRTGKLLKQLTAADGLPDNYTPNVRVGVDGTIWIGTFQGLFKYADGLLTNCYASNGLLLKQISNISLVRSGSSRLTRERQLIVGSDVGLTRIDPNRNVYQTFYAPTRFGPNETVQDVAASPRHTWIATSTGLTFCTSGGSGPTLLFDRSNAEHDLHGSRHYANTDLEELTFQFQTLSQSTDPNDVTYQYRLREESSSGHASAIWRESRDSRIRMTTPQPGRYQLEVIAYDRDLGQSPVVAVPFTVSRPYGRWARSTLLSTSLLACSVLGVLYLRSILKTKQELEIRVKQRTAEALEAQEQQQRLQVELIHAQKMDSLGTMAAGMAHDFNNTLCAIASNAELGLIRFDSHPERVKSSLREVIAATHQAADLTKSLLTFAGKSRSTREPVSLQDVVEDSLKLIRTSLPASIEIVSRADPELVWCHADIGELRHVILNLAMNAKDAMPRGGKLSVEVYRQQAGSQMDQEAIVRVSDNGFGMSSTMLTRIFEPFFTSKPRGKGTGLGLSMAHSVVTAHDGRIAVESQLGTGTVFEIRLPVCAPPKSFGKKAEALQASIGEQQQLSGTIIVADDEPRVRETLIRVFETMGLEAIGVADGQALIQIAAEQSQRLALVVADIDMPLLDGLTALSHLRQLDEDLPAVIITGQANQSPPTLEPGPTAFLRKPFRIQELLQETLRLARKQGTGYS